MNSSFATNKCSSRISSQILLNVTQNILIENLWILYIFSGAIHYTALKNRVLMKLFVLILKNLNPVQRSIAACLLCHNLTTGNSELTLRDMPCYLLLCQSFLKYCISAGNVHFIKFHKLEKSGWIKVIKPSSDWGKRETRPNELQQRENRVNG